MQDKSIIIVYHYIQEPDEKPRMKGLLVNDLELQIMRLKQKDYNIVTLSEYLNATKNLTVAPAPKMAVLSFDDGLKNHIDNVVPIFDKYGIGGSFFISTCAISQKRLAPVHKIHLLLALLEDASSLFGVDDLMNEASVWYKEKTGKKFFSYNQNLIDQATIIYRWDHQKIAVLKYLLNPRVYEPLIYTLTDHLFAKFLGNDSEWIDKFYLNEHDIRKMYNAGMDIGCHTDTHLFLPSLPKDMQISEILESKTILEKILGNNVSLFSYPYGVDGAFNAEIINILKQNDFSSAVTANKGYASNSPDIFSILRIDGNDFNQYVG
jgi:peptidoglycan/xylan/chitin deacetylase (PgdA/CDA1 family)